jgi:hypothetical protein
MALQHGRGKESFREYRRLIAILRKSFLKAIKQGEYFSDSDLQRPFIDLLRDYTEQLQQEELDVELWTTRAEELNEKVYSEVSQAQQEKPPEEEEEQEDEEQETPSNCSGKFFDGSSELSQAEIIRRKSEATRRAILFDDFPSIYEYWGSSPLSLISMIECTSRGFRIWVKNESG